MNKFPNDPFKNQYLTLLAEILTRVNVMHRAAERMVRYRGQKRNERPPASEASRQFSFSRN